MIDQIVTAAFAVLGGVLVYTGGQFVVRLFLRPIQQLRNLIYTIATDFTFYQNRFGYGNSMSKEERIALIDKFRRHASDIRAYVWTLPWYRFWSTLGLVRPKQDMLEASGELIGYSNSVSARVATQWDLLYVRQQNILKLFGFQDTQQLKEPQEVVMEKTPDQAIYEQDGEFFRHNDSLRWGRFQTAATIEGAVLYGIYSGGLLQIERQVLIIFGFLLVFLVFLLAFKDQVDAGSHMDRIKEFEKKTPFKLRRWPKFLSGEAIMRGCVAVITIFNALVAIQNW